MIRSNALGDPFFTAFSFAHHFRKYTDLWDCTSIKCHQSSLCVLWAVFKRPYYGPKLQLTSGNTKKNHSNPVPPLQPGEMSVPPMYQYQTQQPSYVAPMGYSAAPMAYSAAPMMQPYKSAYPAAYSTVQVVQSAQPMTVTAVAPLPPAPVPQPSPIKMPGGFVPAEVSFARLFVPVFSKATFLPCEEAIQFARLSLMWRCD